MAAAATEPAGGLAGQRQEVPKFGARGTRPGPVQALPGFVGVGLGKLLLSGYTQASLWHILTPMYSYGFLAVMGPIRDESDVLAVSGMLVRLPAMMAAGRGPMFRVGGGVFASASLAGG